MSDRYPVGGPDGETSLHVRRMRSGDGASLAWVIERFTPLLLTQARYRLGTGLRDVYEPEDLVHDTWLAAIPRLPALAEKGGRYTPVVVRFLSTALLYRFNNLVRRRLAGRREPLPDDPGLTSDAGPRQLEEVDRVVRDVLAREARDRVLVALDELAPADREVVVLRGIERVDNQDAALLLGLDPNTVAVRYKRALARLRSRLGASVWDDLETS